MSTTEPSGAAGASAAPEAVGARLTASPSPRYDAPRQHCRRRRHRARVHRRLLVGRWRLLGGCRHLRRADPRRHPAPSRGRPARVPGRDRQRTDLTQHVAGGAPTAHADRGATHQTRTTTDRKASSRCPSWMARSQ